MLTTEVLRSLRNYAGERVCATTLNAISVATIRGLLEKGQKLYRFNRDLSGLDVIVFVTCFENLAGGTSYVISNGERDHHNDLRACSYVVRDILLSTRGDYDSECLFLDEKTAKHKLKRYITKRLEAQLLEMTKGD